MKQGTLQVFFLCARKEKENTKKEREMKLTKRGEKKQRLYSTERRSDGESPSLGDSSVIHLSYSSLNALNMCSGLVHWEDPEGWVGEGGGMEDQDGEYM